MERLVILPIKPFIMIGQPPLRHKRIRLIKISVRSIRREMVQPNGDTPRNEFSTNNFAGIRSQARECVWHRWIHSHCFLQDSPQIRQLASSGEGNVRLVCEGGADFSHKFSQCGRIRQEQIGHSGEQGGCRLTAGQDKNLCLGDHFGKAKAFFSDFHAGAFEDVRDFCRS